MKRILPVMVLAAALTAGCTTMAQTSKAPDTDPAIAAIGKSAQQIEADLRQLVLLQSDHKQGGLRAVLPKDGPLGKQVVMKWNGPIEPAIARVARSIRYTHRTLGTAPAAPITVKVDVVKEKAYDVLDSIAWQAAGKAQLLVDPLKRQITLAYLPAFGVPEAPSSPTASDTQK